MEIPQFLPAAAGDRSAASLAPLFELTLGCRLTFDACVDEETLARATRLVLDAEPILGCHFRDGRWQDWQRCEDLDRSIPFSLQETADPDAAAIAFHDEPFGKGPRLAVRLLRHSGGDDVCLRLDHCAGDGRSAKEVAYLLADVYSRLVQDSEFTPEPNLAPRPGLHELWDALTDEQREAAKKPVLPSAAQWRKKVPRGTGEGLAARTLVVPPELLSAVRAVGRQNGATVHDVLTTAVVRSLSQMYPPGRDHQLGVSMSADGRRFVDDPAFERISNVSLPQTIGITHEAEDAFLDTLMKVAEKTRIQKEKLWGLGAFHGKEGPVWVSKAIWRAYVALIAPFGLIPPVIMNIGVLDESRLRFGELAPATAYIAGTFGKTPAFGLTVSTYLDSLTVWIGARQELVDPAINEHLLCLMREELAGACIPRVDEALLA